MRRAADEPMNLTPPRIARGGWLDALRFIVGALIILYHFREASPVQAYGVPGGQGWNARPGPSRP